MNIVFYDTACILCSRTIIFLQKKDKQKKLHFAPIGGTTYINAGIEGLNDNKNTVIFFSKEKVFIRSTAVLQILKMLPYPWKAIHLFIIFPRAIRDWIYIFIANNRYKWFGKITSCDLNAKSPTQFFLP